MNATQYDEHFYELIASSSDSGLRVLGLLSKFHRPTSVVDFGCGNGAWLAAAGQLGASKLIGYDGPWARSRLKDSRIEFRPIDFEAEFPAVRPRADLAISVEVAEHVSEARADDFVDMVCNASDVAVFGGATRLQGGVNHVNEQPATYWISKFEARSYECFDVFRGALWNDPKVAWWCKQNLLLFAARSAHGIDREALRAAVVPILDPIHPELYAARVRELEAFNAYATTGRGLADLAGRYLRQKFAR